MNEVAIVVHGGAGRWPEEAHGRAREGVERALAGLEHLGTAGLIAVGAGGIATPFTTPAMPRGWRVGYGPIGFAVGRDG